MRADPVEWPFRQYWIDLAWMAFAAANLAAMLLFASWETVPFHFIWVSLTILYGFRVWRLKPTALTLAVVMIASGAFIGIDVARGKQPLDELTEVPLMAAIFVAMVWHARRRLAAMEQIRRVSEANVKLLDRERRFLQDASHELRTPITVALGQIELIQRTTPDPLVREDAGIAVDELMRLRRLAERLLLIASAGHPDFLRTGTVPLDELVTDARRRWAATPRRWVLGELPAALVEVDRERIGLAIDSLIENALEHTSEDGRIEIGARVDGRMASIVVADSGCGIPPENLEHVFDRFFRVDAGRSREGGGVGVGLSMVKAISEAHGGSVAARSRPGHGSAFEILLPLARSPSHRGEVAPVERSSVAGLPASPPG